MPTRAADDVGLGERRVEDALAAELALQAVRDLEHAALARTPAAGAVARLTSATSSPKTTMRGSRAISSFSVRLIAPTIVSGLPSVERLGCRTRRRSDRRRRVDVERRPFRGSGFGASSARSAASAISRSTSAADRVELRPRWRAPRCSRNARSCVIGSRSASRVALLAASCTAARRPTASASTAGSPSRARAPARAARARTRRPRRIAS